MTTFTLDTSGAVSIPHSADGYGEGNPLWGAYTWDRLDPVTQGYVEAIIWAAICARWPNLVAAGLGNGKFLGFSDLSPEALAMILADCAAYEEAARAVGLWQGTPEQGAGFWHWRANSRDGRFQLLTVSVGDDGRVHLS